MIASSFQRAPMRYRMPSRWCVRTRAIFDKFTERSIKAVLLGQKEAKSLGFAKVTTAHILLGIIAEDTKSQHGYLNTGITVDKAKGVMALPPLNGSMGDVVQFSQDAREAFSGSVRECKKHGHTYVTPEHMMLTLLGMAGCPAAEILERLDVDGAALMRKVNSILSQIDEVKAKVKSNTTSNKKSDVLETFCRDLCAEAQAGRIDPMAGRESEVARVIQILARRTKNNPILLGEPGVGKTAIAEGLACAIVGEDPALPPFLKNKRVLQLDVAHLVGGTKERGELERRTTSLIAELRNNPDVILFIDEIHMLVAATRGSDGINVANLIKPPLARGEMQCIGATTLDEYRKYIESDAAFARRFQPIVVHEPTSLDTHAILQTIKSKYERYHRCYYEDEALVAAVHLADRYIKDRHFPDKAIDLIDEAGSRARVRAFKTSTNEDPLLTKYLRIQDSKDEMVKDEMFEEAWALRAMEREVGQKILDSDATHVVRATDIEAIVEAWTGIPIQQSPEDARLLSLKQDLCARVIGQDDAVDCLVAALQRARCGFRDPNRPIASLLFVGPTGVGKTELVNALADVYYGSKHDIIRLDMSEYMERHDVTKMLGAPPGFQGFEEGGKLTNAVRQRPFSIVLFDEIEKAHPDVFNVLLQVMEDGRLTDASGRVVSFKNALIVLTSNIGGDTKDAKGVLRAVQKHFKPEFINRLDAQIVFDRLNKEMIEQIAKVMLEETQKKASTHGFGKVTLTEALMAHIASVGYSDEYGARPLRRVITHCVDDVLSEAFLRGDVALGDDVVIDLPGVVGVGVK